MQVLVLMALFMHPGHDIGCDALSWDGTQQAYESRDVRLIGAVERIARVGGIHTRITLCESRVTGDEYVPLASVQIHGTEESVHLFVHIPLVYSVRFTDIAMRGLLAHELAHAVVQKSTDCQMMRFRLDSVPVEEQAACQMPADVKAAEWTDPLAVIAFLEEAERLLVPYTVTEQGARNIRKEFRLRREHIDKHARENR